MSNDATGSTIPSLVVVSLLLFSLSPANESHASASMTETKFIEVSVGNTTYDAIYVMSNGGSINNISSNVENLVIVMGITSPSDGVLDITFPRQLYDALTFTEHSDLGPIVTMDGEDVTEDVEVSQSCEKTSIRMPVAANAENIELSYGDILGAHSHSYPGKIELLKTIEVQGERFTLGLITDAKKCNLSFVMDEKKLHVDIEGRNDAPGMDQGYFRLMIPHDLLGGNYTVLVDGRSVNFTEQTYFFSSYDNIGAHSAEIDEQTPLKASDLVFNYSRDAIAIDIIGTSAIPEFGFIAPIVMAAAIVGIIASKQFRNLKK